MQSQPLFLTSVGSQNRSSSKNSHHYTKTAIICRQLIFCKCKRGPKQSPCISFRKCNSGTESERRGKKFLVLCSITNMLCSTVCTLHTYGVQCIRSHCKNSSPRNHSQCFLSPEVFNSNSMRKWPFLSSLRASLFKKGYSLQ